MGSRPLPGEAVAILGRPGLGPYAGGGEVTTDITELAELKRDVQHLKDRQAILDTISRHARGCDRHDAELINSAYWAEGTDEHGASVNGGSEYGQWANQVHAATSSAHLHHVTTHSCDIDGDSAHTESYVMVVLLAPDEKTAQIMTGRYLDRLERRDGSWRIAVRRSTVEASFAADASVLQNPFFTKQAYLKGTRGNNDLSYARPLTQNLPAPARW